MPEYTNNADSFAKETPNNAFKKIAKDPTEPTEPSEEFQV